MMRGDHLTLTGVSGSLLLLLLHLSFTDCSPPSTLVQVNMLYRHGDRSPMGIYPTDIHQLDTWPDGLGWLSNIGKEQQYLLGQYLRQRYDGFINVTRYDNTEITIQSMAEPRCLMSAYSNLAGLFPPQGDQVWKEGLAWQPIPVAVPALEDNGVCPRLLQLMVEAYSSEKVKIFKADNQEFFNMVSENTGLKDTLGNVWMVGDCLLCEQAHNLTWNEWAQEDGVFEKLMEVQTLNWELLTFTPEMDKLTGGPLLSEILGNMKDAIADKPNSFKVHMYSDHDTTVTALLSAMTVFDLEQPPYAAVVLVELHKIDDDHVVKILYRNETTRDPFYLVPKGCEDPCKLSTFETVLKDTISTDRKAECKALKSSSHGFSPAVV